MSFWKKQLTESTNMLKYASRVIFNDSPHNFFLLTLILDPDLHWYIKLDPHTYEINEINEIINFERPTNTHNTEMYSYTLYKSMVEKMIQLHLWNFTLFFTQNWVILSCKQFNKSNNSRHYS